MNQKKESCVIDRGIYQSMYHLGSFSRSVKEGFFCCMPFLRSNGRNGKYQESSTKPNVADKFSPDEEVTIPSLKRDVLPIIPLEKKESRPLMKEVVIALGDESAIAPSIEKSENIIKAPKKVILEKVEDETKEEVILKDQGKIILEEVEFEEKEEKDERFLKDQEKVILEEVAFETKDELIRAEVYIEDFHSKDSELHLKALEEIKNLPKPTAVEIFGKLLQDEKQPLKIKELLQSLAMINGNKDLDKTLFLQYLDHKSPSVRIAALRALAKYEDEEAFSILSSVLKDKNADIRRQALDLLCCTYQSNCDEILLKGLHDVDNKVRKIAIRFCGVFKLHQGISILINFLNDPNVEIQKISAETLRKITKKRFNFNCNGSQNSKNEAIESWKTWWQKNQTTFGWKLKKEVSDGNL